VTSSVAGQRESGLYSSVCKLLLFLVLLAPVPALAQGDGGGGSGGGGSAEGGLADGASGTAGSAHEAQALPVRRQGNAGTAGNPAGGPPHRRHRHSRSCNAGRRCDPQGKTPDQSKADKKIKSICKGC